MTAWFLFALASAVGQAFHNFFSKYLVAKIPKSVIIFWSLFFCSVILFATSFFRGIPDLGEKFWLAVLTTGILNIAAYYFLFRAYELADLSAVFPMILLTPVFLSITSFFILGEKISLLGFVGILIVILGLFIVQRGSVKNSIANRADTKKGMLYGVIVALIYSLSVNFDKMTVLNSDAFFGGAMADAIITLGVFPFFLRNRNFFLEDKNKLKTLFSFFVLGCIIAFSVVAFYSALSMGLAAYTTIIKRTSVLFGVILGILFLKEKNFLPKIIGSLIAISGIALILLS